MHGHRGSVKAAIAISALLTWMSDRFKVRVFLLSETDVDRHVQQGSPKSCHWTGSSAAGQRRRGKRAGVRSADA